MACFVTRLCSSGRHLPFPVNIAANRLQFRPFLWYDILPRISVLMELNHDPRIQFNRKMLQDSRNVGNVISCRSCLMGVDSRHKFLQQGGGGIYPIFQVPNKLRKKLVLSGNFLNTVMYQNYSTKPNKENKTDVVEETSEKEQTEGKLSLFQRFKQMYRDYWYVLVPVHVLTSIVWFGGFYYSVKSGVDVVSLLESLGVGERITKPLKDSSAGYLAIAYALYKIATPARYTVTLGGTTLSIKYLKEWGYIKPIPPREKLKEMYQERRDNIKESYREKRNGLKQKQSQAIERARGFSSKLKDQK